MKDLSLIDRLPELRRAGVAAIKIEGRLKNAAWVSRAVSLYKRALAGEEDDKEKLLQEAEQLGAYTGRTLTSAYLDAKRDDLTAQAEGRKSRKGYWGWHPSRLNPPWRKYESSEVPESPFMPKIVRRIRRGIDL